MRANLFNVPREGNEKIMKDFGLVGSRLQSVPCPEKDFRKFVREKEKPDGLERCDGHG